MEKREHDLFLDLASNRGATFEDLVVAGVNAKNTALQDKSAYELDEWVRSLFQDQYGEFDKVEFDSFYNNAKVYYNSLANTDYEEAMNKVVNFHRDNIFVPIEQRRKGPDFKEVQVSNPYHITSSLIELGRLGEQTLSMDELAQANKVLLNPTTAGKNLENAIWGSSPNEDFFGYYTDTLVLALYDTNDTHIDPITGKEVAHKAGDPKTDSNGEFYYEKLDGRDVYGRRVLNKMNVLTVDGSKWNDYDFFDSDDINQKSVGGTIMKNLALVGTMFIKPVGPWIAGLSIASLTIGLLGTLGKMLTGSDSPTFSAMEGWAKSVSRQGASSEYAMNHPWCLENMINLAGDVAGLIVELRVLFTKIPSLFKGKFPLTEEALAAKIAKFKEDRLKLVNIKIDELKKTNVDDLIKIELDLKVLAGLDAIRDMRAWTKEYLTIGEVLGKGYMTAITVQDTYGEAKQAGASDIDATLLTLGYAAGEYALLSTGLGQWFMPELRANKLRYEAIAKGLKKLIDEDKSKAMETAAKAIKNTTDKRSYVKKLFNFGKNLAKDVYSANKSVSKNLAVSTIYNGLSEGTEEVSEELLADFSKGCYDVVKWLQGEDTRINSFGYDFKKNEFDLENTLDRYSLSLVGGFIGGSFANIASDFKTLNSQNKIDGLQALQELIYMCRNGEINDFMKTVAKTLLGDTNKSTKYQVLDNKVVFSPGTQSDNLDLAIKQAIQNLVNMLQNIILANGGVSDSEFLSKQTLDDLRFNALYNSTTAGLYLQTYNNLLADIYTLTASINDAMGVDKNKDGVISDKENRDNTEKNLKTTTNVSNLLKELKEKLKELLDLLDGKYALDFISTALIEVNGTMSKMGGIPSVFSLYAESKYKKKFQDLTDDEKLIAAEEFKTLKTTEMRDRLSTFSKMYRQVASLMSPVLTNQATTYQNTNEELVRLNLIISDLYKIVKVGDDTIQLDIAALKAPAEKYLPLAQIAASSAPSQMRKSINTIDELIGLIQNSNDATEVKGLVKELFNIPLWNIGLLLANLTDDKSFTEFTDNEKKRLEDLFTEEKRLLKLINEGLDIESNTELLRLNTENIENLFINYTDEVKKEVKNNIFYIANQFINRGFISTEAKNLVLGLLDFAQNIVNRELSLFDYKHENDMIAPPNPHLKDASLIKYAKNKIENLSSTPIELNLNEIAILLGEKPIKLTELIELANIAFNNMAEDVSTFDTNLSESIKEALNLMNLYKLAILGARTDANNTKNLYGYNATLNEIAGKISEKLDLAEIDSATADKFIVDLDANINKLTYLLNLYNINKSLKLTKNDRIGVKKDLLVYKRLQYTFDFPDKENPLSSWKDIDKLLQAIRGMTLHSLLLKDNLNKVDDVEAFELEKLTAESAIYDFFQANQDKLSNPAELAKLINPSKYDMYSPAKEILDENLENLDDNSFIWWLASRAALRNKDFYYMYGFIIDPTSDKPKAPIPTQELAIYNNIASIVNRNVYTLFYNAYRYAIKEDWKHRTEEERANILRRFGKSELFIDFFKKQGDLDKYIYNIIPVPRYTNIILTEGAPGTGKTSNVFKSTVDILKNFYPDLYKREIAIVHGADIKSADKLKNDLEIENSLAYGRREFMKFINSQWREYVKNDGDNTYSVPESEADFDSEYELRSKLGINDTKNPPSLIIIDEISKFSVYDLDLIDKFAKQYGITVLAAGDFDQSGFVGSHQVTLGGRKMDYRISLDRTNFIRCPKLGISMRTDNDLKTMNLAKTRYYIQDPKGTLELSYALNENGIYGDKVISYNVDVTRNSDDEIVGMSGDLNIILPQVIEDINSLIDLIRHDGELTEEEKIGYIYNNINSPIYKELSLDKYKPYISLKQGGTAQGLEGRFYIVEPDVTADSETFLKDVYTGMSRASQGSILILPAGLDKSILPIYSVEKVAILKEPLPNEIIKKYAQSRKDLLTKLFPETEVPKINTTKLRTKQIVQVRTKLEDGIDPLPAYNYDKDKADFIQAINNVTSIDEIDRFAFELQSRSKGRSKTDLEVIDAINTRKELIILHLNDKQQTWQEKHNSLVNKYVGKYNSPDGSITNGVRIDGLRMVSELRDLDAIITESTNGLWFLPGDTITFNDGTTITPDWLWEDGSMGTEDGTVIPSNVIESFFTGNNNTITSNSRLGDAIRKDIPIEKSLTVSSYYESDVAPATNTDTIATSTLNTLLDDATESDDIPEPEDIYTLGHTFNKYELGVVVNPDLSYEVDDMRIDSINGLAKIDKLLGTSHTLTDYIKIIGRLRNAIFTIPNKSDLEKKIENILGLSGIYTTFAIKTTALPSQQNKDDGRDYVSSNPNPFEKSWREKILYNISKDTRSDEVNYKSLVIIIGTENNLLELPLLSFGSPFTLLSSEYGLNKWPDMYNRYTLLLKTDLNFHTIATTLEKEYENKAGYESIVKKIKFFNISANLIKYIEDPNWTIANDLVNLGINFITEAGYYQQAAGLKFDDTTNPEEEWITLNDFSKGIVKDRPETNLMDHNPLFSVTPILVSNVNEYGAGNADDITLPIKKGHSFVIVCADPENYNTPEDIVNRYLAELQDPSLVKLTYRVYVRPPKASILDYIINLHNANFTKRGLTRDSLVKPIGYFNTSAKLLVKLVDDPEFMELVNRKYPNVVPLLTDAIKLVREALNNTELKDILYQNANWTSAGISYKDTPLCYLFDELLARLGWNDISSLTTGNEPIHEIDPEGIKIIADCLKKPYKDGKPGITGVFYHTPISSKAELLRKVGPFIIGDQVNQSNYSIDGKPYKIHGKIDSFTFVGDFDSLIDSFLDAILTNAKGYPYTEDNKTYFNHGAIGRSALKPQVIDDRKIYIESRTGLTLPVDYTLDSAIDLINNAGLIAFSIDGWIYIGLKNPNVSGKIHLYDNDDNPIRDINNLSDNSGIYSFKISAIIDGKQQKLNASYDSRTAHMEIERVPSVVALQLYVTPETFNDWITKANEILIDIAKDDIYVKDLLAINDYDTFMQAVNEWLGTDIMKTVYTEMLNNTTDELSKLILTDMINIEEFGMRDDPNECLPKIKIIF